MNQKPLIEILENSSNLSDDFKINKLEKAKELLSKDFILYHIQELTFEEKSPRKEAFENVISSLRIDGISFVYLLLGDERGVSFYFGIAKEKNSNKELELDIDDIGEIILKSSIEGNFRGSRVEDLGKDRHNILSQISSMNSIARIDGVPSINEDNEEFQGVDRLVDIMLGDEFGLIILANPLSLTEIKHIEDRLYSIHNKLIPLSKKSIQNSTSQADTKGESIGKNSSNTTGTNNGSSYTQTDGSSDTQTIGTSDSKSENRSNSSTTNGGNESRAKGKNESESRGKTDGTSTSKTIGTSHTDNNSITDTNSNSTTMEYSNKSIQSWIKYIEDVLIPRVDYGRGKGIFNTNIYLLAHNKGTLLKLGNTVISLFSGVTENKFPLKLKYIKDINEINTIKHLQFPTSNLNFTDNIKDARLLFSKSMKMLGSWLSTSELSVIAGLPQKEVVGLALKEEVEFGLNPRNNIEDKNILHLGNLVRSGLPLNIEVNIDKSNLNKHTFITGVTGSGKTTTCHKLLYSSNMPFMVIEPAKTEYRILTNSDREILIFTLGNNNIAPFRLNPFEFFPHENITSRVDMIKASIESAFDMEAAIPQIIESAIYKCYEKYGWDIATSQNSIFTNPFDDGIYSFPTLQDLVDMTQKVVEEQGFDERLQKDYIGSIKARLQGLLIGAKGLMLNTPRSINFKDLVQKNVILELEEIRNPSEKSLIMGFILTNLNEAIRASYEENRDFKHITLIEEAHRLLSKYEAGDSLNKKQGVEVFTDMLAEVRKYGEALIIVDQIPNKLTPEVLKNTNTKIVHKLFAKDDKEAIGNTMALQDEQKEFLSNLETGRAIIFSQDFTKALQVQIKPLDNLSTTTTDIISKKKIRDICLNYYPDNFLEKENHFDIDLINGWSSIIDNFADDFKFDLKKYLIDNKLNDNLDKISVDIVTNIYTGRDGLSNQDRIKYLKEFLKDVIENDKIKFNRKDKEYLKRR